MRGWRTKFIFLLIVYFAGFATAIYMLAPAPDSAAGRNSQSSFAEAFKTDGWAKSLNSGMHKAVDNGKDAACRAGKFIKQKIDEKRQES